MKKIGKLCCVLVGIPTPLGLAYLAFMSLALFALESKYDALRDGFTIEDTDRIMGGLFRAQTIMWDDVPKIYTAHYVEKPGSAARDYTFLGASELNIIVIYDEGGRSYLHIPVYE